MENLEMSKPYPKLTPEAKKVIVRKFIELEPSEKIQVCLTQTPTSDQDLLIKLRDLVGFALEFMTLEETFLLCKVARFYEHINDDDKLVKLISKVHNKLALELSETEQIEQSSRTQLSEYTYKTLTKEQLNELEKYNQTALIEAYVKNMVQGSRQLSKDFFRANYLTILSAVFGQFMSLVIEEGMAHNRLNLWTMQLGPSSNSRKTTTMDSMLRVLRRLENDEFKYIGGSNFTSEALIARIKKAPGSSKVIYRDEAQGWLTEQDKKNYLAGQRDDLNALFSGWTPHVIRKTNDEESKAVPVNLVMYGMGTLREVTRVLTQRDFDSGFLHRFLFTVHIPPPQTKEDKRFRLVGRDDKIAHDDLAPIEYEIVKFLSALRDQLARTLGTVIYNEEEAAAGKEEPVIEYNKFRVQFKNREVEDLFFEVDHKLSDLMMSAGKEYNTIMAQHHARLRIAMLKIAALLSIGNSKIEIDRPEVLWAAKYCEDRFQDMLTVTKMVFSGDNNELGDVLEYLKDSGGKVLKKDLLTFLYQRGIPFNRVREILGMLRTMEKITVSEDGVVSLAIDTKILEK